MSSYVTGDEELWMAQIPERLLYDATLSSNAKVIYGCLQRHGADPSNCFPSIGRLAGLAGIGESTVKRAIQDLIDSGWIRTTRRQNETTGARTSNGYHLHSRARPTADNKARLAGVEKAKKAKKDRAKKAGEANKQARSTKANGTHPEGLEFIGELAPSSQENRPPVHRRTGVLEFIGELAPSSQENQEHIPSNTSQKEREKDNDNAGHSQLSLTPPSNACTDSEITLDDGSDSLATRFVKAIGGAPTDYPPHVWVKDWVAPCKQILIYEAKEAGRRGVHLQTDVDGIAAVIDFVASSRYWAGRAGRPAKLRKTWMGSGGSELRGDIDQARRTMPPRQAPASAPERKKPAGPDKARAWDLVRQTYSDGQRLDVNWLELLDEREDDPTVLAAARQIRQQFRQLGESDLRMAFMGAMKSFEVATA